MISKAYARKLRANMVKASASLSDNDALDTIELFDKWEAGVAYPEGKRLRYGERLYRVRQAHISQADWAPDIATSLYVEVARQGQGDTPDNPIPYNGNMELFEGKYYSQNGVTYVCFRSTGIAVYNDLADLVGIYVNVYTDAQ